MTVRGDYYTWARSKLERSQSVSRSDFRPGRVYLLAAKVQPFLHESPLFIPISYQKPKGFGKLTAQARIMGLNLRAIPSKEARRQFIEMWIPISEQVSVRSANDIVHLTRALMTRLKDKTLYKRMLVEFPVDAILKGYVLTSADLKEVADL